MENYLHSILHYFSFMDITSIRIILNTDYTYQNTTKDIFLNEIEQIFEDHRSLGDTELLIYNGACAGKRCENCGKKGFRFVGNHSKNYMDLIFEIDGDDIKDIYDCSYFQTNVEIDGLGAKAFIYIKADNLISFKRTPDYWFKLFSASAAYNEIITNPPKPIDFEELSNWIDKHAVTDEVICAYDAFNPEMKWSHFSKLYSVFKKIRIYITDYLSYIVEATSEIILSLTEPELIDWIFRNETLYNAAPFELKYSFEKENDCCILNLTKRVILYGNSFNQTFDFVNFYQENHDALLAKYNTYTIEEESELYETVDYENENDDIFSLRFHLEKRKAMKKLGFDIPFYINEEKMPF